MAPLEFQGQTNIDFEILEIHPAFSYRYTRRWICLTALPLRRKQRLSALIAIRRDVAKVQKARRDSGREVIENDAWIGRCDMQDRPDLLDSLRLSGRVLAAFVKAVPSEKLTLRRGDGFWTIAEHLAHLAQVQPMLLERLKRFRDEERPEFVPYIPGDAEEEERPPQIPADKALAAFTRVREEQIDLLDAAGDELWRKTAIHPEYELYSLAILVRHILLHDYWHMYRMETLWLTRDAYLTASE